MLRTLALTLCLAALTPATSLAEPRLDAPTLRAAAAANPAHLLGDRLALAAGPDAALAAPRPERRSLAWAFVPLGVGQFANEQPVKGTLLFVAETAAFATAAGALAAFEKNKVGGELMVSGHFREQDVPLAEKLQTTYLAAFWGGVGLAVIGVIDALLSRPPAEQPVAVLPGAVALRF